MLALTGWRRIFGLPYVLQWLLFGTGPVTSCVRLQITSKPSDISNRFQVGESYGFVRSSDEQLFPKAEFPDLVEDTTTGRDAPDIEVYACKSFRLSFSRSNEYVLQHH